MLPLIYCLVGLLNFEQTIIIEKDKTLSLSTS